MAAPQSSGALDARLDRLEKQQRHLRATVWRVLLFGGGTFLITQLLVLSFAGDRSCSSEPKEKPVVQSLSIDAEQICLRPRPGTPSLVQLDSKGVGRVVLKADGAGRPSLQFYDQTAALRVSITGGGEDGPQIALHDASERPRARLTLTGEGNPRLTLCDDDERARALLTVEKQRPRLLLDESMSPLSRRPQPKTFRNQ